MANMHTHNIKNIKTKQEYNTKVRVTMYNSTDDATDESSSLPQPGSCPPSSDK